MVGVPVRELVDEVVETCSDEDTIVLALEEALEVDVDVDVVDTIEEESRLEKTRLERLEVLSADDEARLEDDVCDEASGTVDVVEAELELELVLGLALVVSDVVG